MPQRRMEEVEGEIKSFLTWALDGDEWWGWRSGRLYSLHIGKILGAIDGINKSRLRR